jgi:prepilin-type N-terminal cleavage/methylation domain-containing protein
MSRETGVRRRGFTLVELLVVVVIIAIVAGAIVVFTGGLATDSAETANIGTIKHLTGQVSAFYQAHGRLMPEGLDSMIRDDFSAMGGTYSVPGTNGFEYCTNPGRIFSCGCDANQDAVTDTNAAFKGVSPVAWTPGMTGAFHGLAATRLTASDVAALNSIGITYAYDISHGVDATNGVVPYVRRALVAGDPVAAFDPNVAGQYASLWTSFGVNQTNAANRSNAARFLVFGLGPNCKMIGDRRGGLQEAPVCPTVAASLNATPGSGVSSYYNRYMVAIRVPVDSAERPRYVGILDAMSWTSAEAAMWATRTE